MKNKNTLLAEALKVLGVRFEIDSAPYTRILRLGDWMYSTPGKVVKSYYKDDVFEIDGSTVSRILYYAPYSLIEYYKRARLYKIMQETFTGNDDLFLDIGANLGIYGYLAQKLGAKSMLFEPEPRLYDFLQRNKSLLGEPYDVALSNKTGQEQFYVGSEEKAGASSLVKEGSSEVITVKTDTLDNWLKDHEIEQTISLVKIDVEGNETDTVHGMENTLEKGQIQTIWCEVRGPQSGRNPNSYQVVTDLLKKYGYEVYRFVEGKKIPFDVERDEAPQVFDLLYIRSKA